MLYSFRGGMEHTAAAMKLVFGQSVEGDTLLARLTMPFATSAITTSVIGHSNVLLSMVASGESIFARSVN